jgi:hypothetical protein
LVIRLGDPAEACGADIRSPKVRSPAADRAVLRLGTPPRLLRIDGGIDGGMAVPFFAARAAVRLL